MVDLHEMRILINKWPHARFRLQRARAKAYSTTQVMTGMPHGSSSGDGVMTAVERVMLQEEAYKALCDNLKQMQDQLEPMIQRLDTPIARTAMYERYIRCQPVMVIAISLGYSREYIHKVLRSSERKITSSSHSSHRNDV